MFIDGMEFTERQVAAVDFVTEEVRTRGYGLYPSWMPGAGVKHLYYALRAQYGAGSNFVSYDFDTELGRLPEPAEELIGGLGRLAQRSGLRPRQVAVIVQDPSEPGDGHFDRNTRIGYAVPLSSSTLSMFRPSVDQIPNMSDEGVFDHMACHRLHVPKGSLLGFAGALDPLASYHALDNPSDQDMRFSMALGCQ